MRFRPSTTFGKRPAEIETTENTATTAGGGDSYFKGMGHNHQRAFERATATTPVVLQRSKISNLHDWKVELHT
jgi:hypothetical protein